VDGKNSTRAGPLTPLTVRLLLKPRIPGPRGNDPLRRRHEQLPMMKDDPLSMRGKYQGILIERFIISGG